MIDSNFLCIEVRYACIRRNLNKYTKLLLHCFSTLIRTYHGGQLTFIIILFSGLHQYRVPLFRTEPLRNVETQI